MDAKFLCRGVKYRTGLQPTSGAGVDEEMPLTWGTGQMLTPFPSYKLGFTTRKRAKHFTEKAFSDM